ncbi:DUF58 domain-containing protein [Sedimentitalea sp. XS_ASV28]|uniref:DUF58 domain-containing protein n=1 Tax=Sedimentitalea sp. XS_ASV28 TaxID=3241296 RepID=UPI0035195A4C
MNIPGVALHADALIALRPLALHPEAEGQLAALPGGFVTRRRGHGQEMADVREYVAGDDIRHLDRGSTARTGVLHVRSFQEERDRVTLLVADFRPAMLWGTRRALRSVAAAEALALVGWRVIEQGGRVGLLAIGSGAPVVVAIQGRVRGMLAVIGGLVRAHDAALHLALAGNRDDPPLDEAIARVTRIAPAGSEIVIASGFDSPGPSLDDRLGQIAQRRMPRPVLVTDDVTENLPPGVYPIRLPDGSRRRVRISGRKAAPRVTEIAGFPALPLDAGQQIATTARVLQAAFPPDRAP